MRKESNTENLMVIGQICGKVAMIDENCKSAQNLRMMAEFAFIVAIATSWLPEGTGRKLVNNPHTAEKKNITKSSKK